MATREASLKVTMNTGSVTSAFQQMQQLAVRTGQAMGHALHEPIHAGIHGAKEAFLEVGKSIKETVKGVAMLGGGIGLAEFVHKAVEVEDVAGRIAMKLRSMGEHVAVGEVIDRATHAAQQFGMTTEETMTAYEAMLAKTGEPLFAEEALGSVGLMRNALRVTAEQAGSLAALMHKKLGAGAEDINNKFLPAIMDLTNKGGVSIEDLANNGEHMLAMLAAVGETGSTGFTKLLGYLNMTNEAGGEVSERLMGMKAILVRLANEKQLKLLSKESGFSFNVKGLEKIDSSFDRLHALLGTKGGFEGLEKVFGANPRTALLFGALVKPFKETVDHMMKDGPKTQARMAEARQAGLKAFDDAFRRASETTADGVTVQEEAHEATKETSRKLTLAFDRMARAFENEKMLDAISRLADVMPKFADVMAKMVGFAVEHPVAGGAAVVGTQVAAGAATGFVTAGAKSLLTKAAPGGLKIAGSGLTAAGGGLAAVATLPVTAAAAIGGGLAFAIHKADVESETQHGVLNKGTEDVVGQAVSARFSRSNEKKRAALVSIQEQRKRIEGSGDVFSGTFGGLVAAFSGTASPEQQKRDALLKLSNEEAKLQAQLVRSTRDIAASMQVIARHSGEAARNSSRGPLPPPETLPGHTEQGG